MSTPKLFTGITLGGKVNPIKLQHRVVMAPLTRLRAGDPGVQPDIVAKYYGQRATEGGLIIAEATNIAAYARGYFGAPGIFNQEQIDSWKPVTKAVHDKGGVIFLQLWHTGRTSHPSLQPDGILPVSSSTNMPLDENRTVPTKEGSQPLVRPRALETDEIPEIIKQYGVATKNAIEAGFDGVEIHSANGYLLEQFIHDGINDRTDKYGGSIENRSRFLFEVFEEVLKHVDSSQVAVRLSPFGKSCGQFDSDPLSTYTYILNKLNELDLAYVHLIEPRGMHYPNDLCPSEGSTVYFRKIYRGVLMGASGYDRQSSIDAIENNEADLVAIGRYFITNPDLVKRFELNARLTPFENINFYYPPTELNYTDFKTLEEEEPATEIQVEA